MATINSNGTGGGSWNAGASWNGGVAPGTGDQAVIVSDDTITLTAAQLTGSCYLNGGGILVGGGYTLTCDDGGSAAIFDNDGTISGVLNIDITGITSRTIDFIGTGNPNNLTLSSNATFTLAGAGTHTLDGNLIISTNSILNTSVSNLGLTVAGTTTVTGTLTLNASTCNFTGSISGAGTVNCDTATITVSGGGADFEVTQINMDAATIDVADRFGHGTNTDLNISGTSAASITCDAFAVNTITSNGNSTVTLDAGNRIGALVTTVSGSLYNVIVNSTGTKNINTNITIDNNLTITAGTLETNATLGGGGTDRNLTVTGETDITGTLNCYGGTHSFGSGITSDYAIRVRESGTFDGGSGAQTIGSLNADYLSSVVTLSSGVTTFDSAKSSNDITIALRGSTTFDDGNGTVTFTFAGTQLLYESNNTARTFYNVTLNKASGTVQYFNAYGFTLTIANNFTITAGTFDNRETVTNTARDLTVTGNTSVANGATLDVY